MSDSPDPSRRAVLQLSGAAFAGMLTFAAKTGRYLRLRALSEVNGNPWTSDAELNVGVASI